MARSIPSAMASRSCSAASGGPRVSTTDSPWFASIKRTASSTPHSSCGLIVNPRCFVSSDISPGARTILPPVNGTLLTQTRTFTTSDSSLDSEVVRIKDRCGAGHRHRDRVALAHVFDGQGCAGNGMLGRQVCHEDVLADRRPGAGARDVRAPAFAVDDSLAVAGEDG